MSIFKAILISLILTSSAAAQKTYAADELTTEIMNQLESPDSIEMFPNIYQDDLTPEELDSTDPYFDRWRRRPKPEPSQPDPFQPEEPEFDRNGPEFPILKRLCGLILKLPIIREVSALIYKFGTILTLGGLWLIPVYVLRWRFVWPIDIVTGVFGWFQEHAKNTKKPFE